MERSKKIFGNKISRLNYLDACFSKQRFVLKYGDDSKQIYHLKIASNPLLHKYFGVQNLLRSEKPLVLPKKSVVIGNIRMGFGHYRISMAIASCAYALGYTPCWLDLNNFKDTTGSKVIDYYNEMYSLGSRISQRFPLFDKLFWEPGSKNMYKRLESNAIDQKNSELMTRAYQDLPKNIPFIATHSWPAQAAIHAGLTAVVNAIPDNYPLALHLAEGAVHTVQTPSAELGYKTLFEMVSAKSVHSMPEQALVYAGHYVDDDIAKNISLDCARRIKRINSNLPLRFLMPVGGAGAGIDMIAKILERLIVECENKNACVFLNLGDHIDVLDILKRKVKNLEKVLTIHADDFTQTESFCNMCSYNETLAGVHVFCHKNIFAAVYSTNLLMREADIMVTKPSELAFYPIPKLLIRRVGAHEAYGALRSSELGDGTIECRTFAQALQMLELLLTQKSGIVSMCENIIKADKIKVYDGGYAVVKTAIKLAKGNKST